MFYIQGGRAMERKNVAFAIQNPIAIVALTRHYCREIIVVMIVVCT